MRIKRLEMTNFRGIEHLILDFPEEGPLVLIGANGVGKSSVLECLDKLLRYLITEILEVKELYVGIMYDEIMNNKKVASISLKVILEHELIDLDLTGEKSLISNTMTTTKTAVPLDSAKTNILEKIYDQLENNSKFNLFLTAYYSVNRTLDAISGSYVPKESQARTKIKQIDAYELKKQHIINFRPFFEWFKAEEDLENEIRLNENPHYRAREIEVVRNAISKFLKGFSGLRIRRSPLRMVISKNEQELVINQLSDGEKGILTLVGDLARRLAIANPGLEDPLQGEGVVMIDEIELHLHPAWQREIIPNLIKAFSKIQFIVTTHSPQVLSEIQPECIRILKEEEGKIVVHGASSSFGQESNRILEDLMGVSARPQHYQMEIRKLFRLISEGDLEQAKQLRNQLAEEIGDDSEFVKADMIIRRKEVIGR